MDPDNRRDVLLESHHGDGWDHAVHCIMGYVKAEEERLRLKYNEVMMELKRRVIFTFTTDFEISKDICKQYEGCSDDSIIKRCVEEELSEEYTLQDMFQFSIDYIDHFYLNKNGWFTYIQDGGGNPYAGNMTGLWMVSWLIRPIRKKNQELQYFND